MLSLVPAVAAISSDSQESESPNPPLTSWIAFSYYSQDNHNVSKTILCVTVVTKGAKKVLDKCFKSVL